MALVRALAEVETLKARVDTLKSRETDYKRRLDAAEAENKTFKEKLTTAKRTRVAEAAQLQTALQTAATLQAEKDEQEADLPEAIWGGSGQEYLGDPVFRCPEHECLWEVVDNACCQCETEVFCDFESYPYAQGGNLFSLSMDSEAENEDRSRAPRGSTPVREIDVHTTPPAGYIYDDYCALLQRGATRLMCQTFYLEFTSEDGIYLWADSDLYEQFAGPAMLKGDFWKIQLGRYIGLDDDDVDGSEFIEGLIEDAFMFPGLTVKERWQTKKESPGIWVSRPPPVAADNGPPAAEDEDTGNDASDSDEMPDEDSDDDPPTLCGIYDKELENPVLDRNADFPVIVADSYEEDSSSGSEDSLVKKEDNSDVDMSGDEDSDFTPDEAFDANAPDGIYGSDSEEATSVQEGSEHALVVEDQDMESNSVVNMESDSEVDSDFDEEEVLSGDEFVLRMY